MNSEPVSETGDCAKSENGDSELSETITETGESEPISEPIGGKVTPQSTESKESEWTAVDKSESDDWEREFDIEMTEEEIENALKNAVSKLILNQKKF